MHARRLTLFQKATRGGILPRYHIFARTLQTDRRSNESVIMDVARNNENLLVATAFNSDAIRLRSRTRTITRARAFSGMESHLRTGRMKSISEECSDKMKAATREILQQVLFCVYWIFVKLIGKREGAFFKIILNVFYLYRTYC